jgi:SAM-dependent methyltransferase
MELEEVHCIFCGPGPTSPYHTENGFAAVRCGGCGLVFVTPRPTEASMKHLYEGQETKIDLARQIANVEHTMAEARRSLALIQEYKTRGDVLELGCAAGYFLREARRLGFGTTGIELTHQFALFAREVLGLDVREGSLLGLPLPAHSFDVVYHRNVLSHLGHPVASFERIHDLLRPDGLMVFQTGNVAELPGEHWRGTAELDLPDHLYHYGESTLRLLLTRTGFEVLRVERYPLLAHEPWIRRLVARLRGAPKTAATDAHERPKPAYVPPRVAPRVNPLKELGQVFEGMFTYELGALLPPEGRRATLKVVARKRARA